MITLELNHQLRVDGCKANSTCINILLFFVQQVDFIGVLLPSVFYLNLFMQHLLNHSPYTD